MATQESQIRDLMARVNRTEGWGAERTSGGKWMVCAPNGKCAFVSPTATLSTTLKNAKATLKRLGFEF